jgi:hypothetical protein
VPLDNFSQFLPVLASPSQGDCQGINEIMRVEAITQCLAQS